MNAQYNAPISDRFSSLCARVFLLPRQKREDPGNEVGESVACIAGGISRASAALIWRRSREREPRSREGSGAESS